MRRVLSHDNTMDLHKNLPFISFQFLVLSWDNPLRLVIDHFYRLYSSLLLHFIKYHRIKYSIQCDKEEWDSPDKPYAKCKKT